MKKMNSDLHVSVASRAIMHLTLAGFGLLAATGAAASEVDARRSSSLEVDEIVITAQRREENMQRVPVSVQVVTQEALTQQNLTTIVSLAEIIPSVHVFGSGRSSNFYIRGTGSGESQSFDQSVGTFIDDIYHGRSRLSGATFLDLDHIEVLKGPQTTFFGNNAIAGAFSIVTKKPSQELEGWARALISPSGDDHGGQYAVEGAVNLPLTEDLALRVTGTANGMQGYLRNIVTDDRAPNKDNVAGRATLRYEPNEDLDITLKGEVSRNINKGGLVLRNMDCPPPSPYPAAGFCALNLQLFGTLPSLKSREYIANEGNQTRLHTDETVLTINYQMGDHTLSSVTGYNGYRFLIDLDNDGTPLTLLNVHAPESYRQFSQELRLASPVGETIEFLTGLYFQASRLRIEQQVSFFFLSPAAYPPLAAISDHIPFGQDIRAKQQERTYSAFGSLSWNVTDQLKLTGALRGSIITKDFDWQLNYGTATQDYGGIIPFPADVALLAPAILNRFGTIGSVSLDRNDKALMPSVRLQYQIDPSVMAYASYNRGFKAGGFSVAETSANPVNYPFKPEHVNAYEIGLKSEFLDRRVLLNVSAFRNDFSDLQVVVQGTGPTGALINFVRNAAASRSQGIELETAWLVHPMFRLSATGTYLDSKYRSYPNAGATYAQQWAYGLANPGQPRTNAVQDLSGQRTLFSPKWSGNITGTLTVPVSDDYTFTLEATGVFSSWFHTYSTDEPQAVQKGYGRLDMRVSLDSDDGRWGADIIGKNLTNTVIRTFTGQQPNSFGSLYQDRMQLRNIAFQVRYAF